MVGEQCLKERFFHISWFIMFTLTVIWWDSVTAGGSCVPSWVKTVLLRIYEKTALERCRTPE